MKTSDKMMGEIQMKYEKDDFNHCSTVVKYANRLLQNTLQ